MKVKEGIMCAFVGNLVVLGLLIIFPQIVDFMLSIPTFISIPLGIILLIIASIIFQWSVSKPQTQAEQSSVS